MVKKRGCIDSSLFLSLKTKNLVGVSTFLTMSEVAEASQGHVPLLLLIRILN